MRLSLADAKKMSVNDLGCKRIKLSHLTQILQKMRMKFADSGSNVQQGDSSVDKSQGAARAISSLSAAFDYSTLLS